MSSTNYRPDIDGLRALAVVAVLLFHANARWLPGGFTGVDVFFVISGYLISSHLFSSLKTGTFSYKEFYRKRINRILPAFYVMIVLTILVCGLFYLPSDFYAAVQSAHNALKLQANLYFAQDYDYFSPANGEKPLLNLWSLSVEEQFYLFLPPILWVLVPRLRFRLVRAVIFLLLIASLAFAEFSRLPQRDLYYWLSARAFELLVGVLLAASDLRPQRRWHAEVLGVAGLAMLGFSFLCINESMRFPGLIALWPCGGTALVILAGQSRDVVTNRLLKLRPVVFIGLISYSLYLAHWPIFAVARYLLAEQEIPPPVLLPLIALAFFLAFLSWKFVESPWRRSKAGFRRVFFFRFLIPTSVILAALSIVTATRGLPQRHGSIGPSIRSSVFPLSRAAWAPASPSFHSRAFR
ncbi:MAG: acyltransferase [Bdellovibrionaceae bacterium]|nr:acyltransferase [Pseudobdellovibrionaceae bacterium]